MIDISDSQYGTQIRKKFSPKPSDVSNKSKA
jgi:transposase